MLVKNLKRGINLNIFLTVFLAAMFTDIFTYVVTSLELALAFPAVSGGFFSSFLVFSTLFAVTQIPLAILEGVVIALAFKYIIESRAEILVKLNVLSQEQVIKIRESFT